MVIRKALFIGIAGLTVLFMLGHVQGEALDTSFTYQGRLHDAGNLADGQYDFLVSLWDQVSGGNEVGTGHSVTEVAVEDGYFTIPLDFGDVFEDEKLWLQISVRPSIPNFLYINLSPRIELTPTPHAHFAKTAETADTALSVVGGIGIDGSGTANFIPKFADSNTLTDSLIYENKIGIVLVGRTTRIGDEFFGINAPVDSGWGGMHVNTDGKTARPFYGYSTAKDSRAWHYYDGLTGDWRLHINGNDRLTVAETGNVAIGSTNTTNARLNVVASGNCGRFENSNASSGGFAVAGSTIGSGVAVQGDARGSGFNAVGVWAYSSNGSDSLPLRVTQNGAGNNLAIFQQNGVEVAGFANDGSLRIGTTSSSYKLNVQESSTTENVANIERTSNAGSGPDILQLITGSGSSANSQFIECQRGNDIEFRVWGDGDVSADGSFTPGGADYAEMIRVSTGTASVEPGDVVVIDISNNRSVVKSYAARSTLVAGVYSTQPGIIGSTHDWDQVEVDLQLTSAGQTSDVEEPTYKTAELGAMIDEAPIAVVGIVPCKVTSEGGDIRPGDLLVSSSTPGHAMRDDDPRVGTVIGKAMGTLSTGSGVIEVMVTLQ